MTFAVKSLWKRPCNVGLTSYHPMDVGMNLLGVPDEKNHETR